MQWDSDEEAERVGPVFENEAAVSAASKQRVKRYRFKTFAQRIAEVIHRDRDALARLLMQIVDPSSSSMSD